MTLAFATQDKQYECVEKSLNAIVEQLNEMGICRVMHT